MCTLRKGLLLSFLLLGWQGTFAFDAPTRHTFTITGYYSPLPGQNFYVTGDYASEIRLNGRGIAGANGVGVYPGMMAAPKSFAFGTRVCVPGFGCGTVHDRGQAIVNKGERRLAKNDRLDLWMGYGEEGLLRALAWGVQHLECDVYPVGFSVAETVDFSIPLTLHDVITLPEKVIFSRRLSRGARGAEVKQLQEHLQYLGFYDGGLHGSFNQELWEAVLAFQKKHFIVASADQWGAGVFGPQTQEILKEALYRAQVEERLRVVWESFEFENILRKGHRNQAVLKLQRMLVREELLDVTPTSYFGPKTEAAVKAFQLRYGVIQAPTDAGAGKVGPKTLAKLNELLQQVRHETDYEGDKVLAYKKAEERFQVLAQKKGGLSGSYVQR